MAAKDTAGMQHVGDDYVFSALDELGSGSFATVFKGTDKNVRSLSQRRRNVKEWKKLEGQALRG